MPSDCLAANQSLARLRDVSPSSQWVSYSASLAIILLDREGRIVAANTRGKVMLLQEGVLRNDRGYLSIQGHYRAALRESVRQVLGVPPADCSGFSMCISPVRLPVSVIVKPHKNGNAAAVVAVSDPNEKLVPDIRVLMMLYGVTATEGAVASALVSGLNVAETAKAHAMTVNTVRTHLKRLFEKTGARRQAELILIILSSSACFDPCQPAADWLSR
jgi:DNA-binding CsgD family transcriptional regulator